VNLPIATSVFQKGTILYRAEVSSLGTVTVETYEVTKAGATMGQVRNISLGGITEGGLVAVLCRRFSETKADALRALADRLKRELDELHKRAYSTAERLDAVNTCIHSAAMKHRPCDKCVAFKNTGRVCTMKSLTECDCPKCQGLCTCHTNRSTTHEE